MAGKKDLVKDSDRYSILVKSFDKCYVCGSKNVHIHEVFGGNNRGKSKEDGLCLPLCQTHHTGQFGPHTDHSFDIKLKQWAERVWLQTYTDKNLTEPEQIKLFISRYGKNYID